MKEQMRALMAVMQRAWRQMVDWLRGGGPGPRK